MVAMYCPTSWQLQSTDTTVAVLCVFNGQQFVYNNLSNN